MSKPGWIANLVPDIKFGLRMLTKTPSFTLAAVLCLSLGIGANTAIFSLINAILLKSLPVKDPEQLLILNKIENNQAEPGAFSHPEFQRLRDQNEVFSGLFAMLGTLRVNVRVRSGDAAQPTEQVQLEEVSGDYFNVLGVNAALGRTITADDDKTPDAHPVAVISHNFWDRRWQRDTRAIGSTIELNGGFFEVIGVAPPEFLGVSVGSAPDVWVPMMMQSRVLPDRVWYNDPNTTWYTLMGRLKAGVTEQQAGAGINALYSKIKAEESGGAGAASTTRIEAAPGSKGLSSLRQKFSRPLQILLAVVVLILLIACANVAGLLMVRSNARDKEISLRLALGAGRGRIIQQLLTENVLLSIISGAVGILLAYTAMNVLIAMVSTGRMPVLLDLQPDIRMLLFTLGISLLPGILFGIGPALRVTRVDLTTKLKEGGASGGTARTKIAKALVIGQITLSVLLLVGATLFLRTLQNLHALDMGFNRSNVLVARLDPLAAGYKGPQLSGIYKELFEKVEALPGVQSVSLGQSRVIAGGMGRGAVSVPGYVPREGETRAVPWNVVSPGYFETLGMHLLSGRDFTWRDDASASPVAVINQTMAHYYFGDEDPVGKRLRLGGFATGAPQGTFPIEIVGVVKDAKYTALQEASSRFIYIPYMQAPSQVLESLALHVRTATAPQAIAESVRREVLGINQSLLQEITTLADQVDATLLQERLVATLSGFFGSLALLLACLGLYGVMSYSVLMRRREIGIRMALGATPGDVLWLVLKESVTLVAVGLAVGIPLAVFLSRTVASMFFQARPTDPVTIGIALLAMVGVVVVAGVLPASRASRVDPVKTLRYE
jgi:predicted permease